MKCLSVYFFAEPKWNIPSLENKASSLNLKSLFLSGKLVIALTIWKEMTFLLPSATKCWKPMVLFIRFIWIPGESDPVATRSEY